MGDDTPICTVYYNQAFSGSVSSGGAEDRVKGDQVVVVEGQTVCGEDVDGRSEVVMDGGRGGD